MLTDEMVREAVLATLSPEARIADAGPSRTEMDKMRKALEAVAPMIRDAAWQPIETAPKDGTRILTWGPLHEDAIGERSYHRVSSWQGIHWFSACTGSHAPTLWRPLDDPASNHEPNL